MESTLDFTAFVQHDEIFQDLRIAPTSDINYIGIHNILITSTFEQPDYLGQTTIVTQDMKVKLTVALGDDVEICDSGIVPLPDFCGAEDQPDWMNQLVDQVITIGKEEADISYYLGNPVNVDDKPLEVVVTNELVEEMVAEVFSNFDKDENLFEVKQEDPLM